MSILSELKRNRLEDKASKIINKANDIRKQVDGRELMAHLFGSSEAYVGSYEESSHKAYVRGFNFINGNYRPVERITDYVDCYSKAEDREGMPTPREVISSFDKICLDSVVGGLESGVIPKDADKLSTEEFLEAWKNSNGETEISILEQFKPLQDQMAYFVTGQNDEVNQ